MGHCTSRPDERFSDSLLDLVRMEQGSYGLPMVQAWEADDKTWGVEVTIWSSNACPTLEEMAALSGTLNEVLSSTRIELRSEDDLTNCEIET
jgi:hypothetical protein